MSRLVNGRVRWLHRCNMLNDSACSSTAQWPAVSLRDLKPRSSRVFTLLASIPDGRGDAGQSLPRYGGLTI